MHDKYRQAFDLFEIHKATDVEAKHLVILGLYVDGKISLSKAAEIYGLSLQTFIDLLAKKGVPAIRYTTEMFEEEKQGVEDILAKRVGLPGEQWTDHNPNTPTDEEVTERFYLEKFLYSDEEIHKKAEEAADEEEITLRREIYIKAFIEKFKETQQKIYEKMQEELEKEKNN